MLIAIPRIYLYIQLLSDYRWSFKNLLPMYNIISDLKEYNIKKKALIHLKDQLQSDLDQKERLAKEKLCKEYKERLELLRSCFENQKTALHSQLEESSRNYITDSYYQYLALKTVINCKI